MATPPPASDEDKKPFACIPCVQRKVKCDKLEPCLSCRKSRLQCSYRSTPPPQRRKRKHEFYSNQALLERLRSHEVTLRNAGLSFDPFDHPDEPAENDNRNDGDGDGDGEAGLAARGGDKVLDSRQRFSQSTEPKGPRRGNQKPPGVLVSEHGGLRYYEHALIGNLGQEVRRHHIICVECLPALIHFIKLDTVPSAPNQPSQS